MKSILVTVIALPFIMVTLRCGFSPVTGKLGVNEKSIVKFSTEEADKIIEVKYDRPTGAYAYQNYDSTKDGAYLVTRNGKSPYFYGIMFDNSVFDKQGNFYCLAYNIINETQARFYVLKNSDSAAAFDNINGNWAEKDGRLFFAAKENGKSFLAALDLSTGTITKGKAYDDILLCYYPPSEVESEESSGYPGFTKEGKPYYIALSGKKSMLVVGNDEQKPYAYIDPYSVTFDNLHQPVYTASDKMGAYEQPAEGSLLLVQGTTEYSKYYGVYGPVQFDKNNQPLYGAETKDNKSGQSTAKLMLGNDVISAKYSVGYSYSTISPQGKVVFVGLSQDKDGKPISCLVVDGKEGKKYSSIMNLTFTPAGVPMYVASDRDREFIVKSEERITADYESILEYGMLKNGKFAYAVFERGDFDKKIPDKNYVNIAGTQYGPYDNLKVGEGDIGKDFLTDEAGNFTAVTYKFLPEARNKEECSVITNKGASEKFENIGDVKLVEGKVYFVGNRRDFNGMYFDAGKVYCDFKPITEEYRSISDLSDDATAGNIGFTGIRGGEAFWVEIKY